MKGVASFGTRILRVAGFSLLMSTVMFASLSIANAQTLTWLGTLGGSRSEAWGVSADGSVVVGWAFNASGVWRAFRWTASDGMVDLGTLGGSESWAYGVSADGRVVVGWAYNASGQYRAFRWTPSGGMQDLGTLGGNWSWALGVSADGSVVVGWAFNASGLYRAFRWTQAGGMQDLGALSSYAQAYDVSADGSVVVGHSGRAFRWTASDGMQDLGTLGGVPGGTAYFAYGVSDDGSVVVGWAWWRTGNLFNPTNHYRAFRWTAQSGMVDLGTLGGSNSQAYDVSADGSVVVGWAETGSGQRAFRWTQAGMEDLNSTYASLLTNGSVLSQAYAISPDGRYIVGRGYNAATGREEAFLLDTGCPLGRVDVNGDGVVDDADLLMVLFNFGRSCN